MLTFNFVLFLVVMFVIYEGHIITVCYVILYFFLNIVGCRACYCLDESVTIEICELGVAKIYKYDFALYAFYLVGYFLFLTCVPTYRFIWFY